MFNIAGGFNTSAVTIQNSVTMTGFEMGKYKVYLRNVETGELFQNESVTVSNSAYTFDVNNPLGNVWIDV